MTNLDATRKRITRLVVRVKANVLFERNTVGMLPLRGKYGSRSVHPLPFPI